MTRVLKLPQLSRCAAIALAIVCVAWPAVAQNISQDATIIGRVTDDQKGVLPGVTVTATSPALQAPSVSTVTDANGEYRLTPLPIGTYTVEYALEGFKTNRQEGVRLTAGFTAKLDVSLGLGAMQETVTVSGVAPQVDTAATNTVTQLTKETLQNIPTGGAGYVGLIQMIPGARASIDVGGNTLNQNPSFVELGSVAQTWQSVDGVATKNPRSTESGNYFDFSNVEEATAATLGHDASIPNRGLNLNVVLTAGGNQFHGGAFYGGTNHNLEGTGAAIGGTSLQVRDDIRADLGGRLIRDRVWFWGSVRKQRDHMDIQGCFQPDGKTLCDQYQEALYMTTKWTSQISKSNRLNGFFSQNTGPQRREMTTLAQWLTGRQMRNEVRVGKVEWQGVRGNSLVMTANYGGWEGHSGTLCPDGTQNLNPYPSAADMANCSSALVATTDTVTGVQTGLSQRCCERLLESRYQVRFIASYYKSDWLGGNHDLKFGLDFFDAPQNRHDVSRGASGNMILFLNNGVPNQISFSNGPVHPDLHIYYTAPYIADSWTIKRKFTLNLGIRYANDAGVEGATCRDAANYPAAAIFPAACFAGTRMTVYRTFAPRIRAAYDLTGDGLTVIKGGWGRFQQMRSADQLQLVAQNVTTAATYKWHDLNGDKLYQPGEVNLDLNGSDFISLAGVSGYGGIQGGINNPNETTPWTDEYSLQFERQLTKTMALRVTGVERRVLNQQRIFNPLRPYSAYTNAITNVDPGPDGKVGTTDDPGRSITYYDYPSTLVGRLYSQGEIVNDPKANEAYHTLELSLTKRMSSNWQAFVSSTITKKHWPLVANAGTFNTVDPNSEINAADDTWEWMARAMGSYMFPHGIQVSANFETRSGTATARTARFSNGANVGAITLRVEPIGSIRLPEINLLSFRAEKSFQLGNGRRISGRINVYNTLNTDAILTETVQSGANFGLALTRIPPRIASLEMEFRF